MAKFAPLKCLARTASTPTPARRNHSHLRSLSALRGRDGATMALCRATYRGCTRSARERPTWGGGSLRERCMGGDWGEVGPEFPATRGLQSVRTGRGRYG